MDSFQLRYAPGLTPIPQAFFSVTTGGPFDRCMLCNLFLLAEGTNYVIEKACKRHPEFGVEDTVFEYALCVNCLAEMSNQMSEESMGNIQEYFMTQTNMGARQEVLMQQESFHLPDWIGNCLVKGTPIEELTDYQILGTFSGEKMVYHTFPYVLGGEAMKEMSLLLSSESLGEIDGFMENFGLPPELRELWKDKPLIII